jgi:hydroxymethylpyrimidine/phosphomethylpyrimidine kinase
LTIAGSDSGGGAGIQADLKTFAAHGVYGASAITAVTAQNTLGVSAVAEIPLAVVAAQIDAVLGDIGADAIKIGMLASAAIIDTVAERLRHWLPLLGRPPVILDPVMVAQSGAALLRDDAVERLLERLFPLAEIVTPNLPEAARLLGRPVASREEQAAAARDLAALGPAVLLKGGHAEGAEILDVLQHDGAHRLFSHDRIESRSTHGTGCTLAAAIAARRAQGHPLEAAVEGAISYLQAALRAAYPLGTGCGPVNHFFPGVWER